MALTQPGVEVEATNLVIRPCTTHTGAEIFGVDLCTPLDPAVVAKIRAALLRWKVIFFRDQELTIEQHSAFARQFGELTRGHSTLAPAFPDHPELLVLDNQRTAMAGTDTEKKSMVGAEAEGRWHTDQTHDQAPPLGAILRGVIIPPYGGDTQWTNLTLAYASLSEDLQTFLDHLTAVHHRTLVPKRGDFPPEVLEKFVVPSMRATHPVVRVHPETGEKSLFVNPHSTYYISELTRQESGHILAMLYEHMVSEEFTVRFRWQPGSIAFWDNRCTAHLAPLDLPPDVHRVMHRVNLKGDIPVGPSGFRST